MIESPADTTVLCVCNEEPMSGEPLGPTSWQFTCASCGAVVFVVDDNEVSIEPTEPTRCEAGTVGKIAVMSQRWRRGESLFAVADNPDSGRRPGAPGVSYDDERGRWQVRVSVPGLGMRFVGTFGNEEVARSAADLARGGQLAEAVALAGGEGRSARRR